MRSIATVLSFILISIGTSVAQTSPPPSPQDTTAQAPSDFAEQCEETIRQRNVPAQSQYVDALAALAKAFQAKGDLENLLVITKEQKRPVKAWRIEDGDIVQAPAELRTLQMKHQAQQRKLSQQVAKECLTMLEEWKKKLTVQGKIEEALSVKAEFEKIQQRYGVTTASDLPPPKTEVTGKGISSPQTVKQLPLSAQIKLSVDSSTKSYDINIRVKNTGMNNLNPVTIVWGSSSHEEPTLDQYSRKETISLKPMESWEKKVSRSYDVVKVFVGNELAATYHNR